MPCFGTDVKQYLKTDKLGRYMATTKKEKESMKSTRLTEHHSTKVNNYGFIEKLKRDVTKNPGISKELIKIKNAVARMQTSESRTNGKYSPKK